MECSNELAKRAKKRKGRAKWQKRVKIQHFKK
jgi:hypothetical protein